MTPGSVVRHASVVKHVTDRATQPGFPTLYLQAMKALTETFNGHLTELRIIRKPVLKEKLFVTYGMSSSSNSSASSCA